MTIDDIKAANKALGHHFFDADSMRFFQSHIGKTVYSGGGGVYFVTSEQFVASNGERMPRAYTVRRANADGGIDTIDRFNRLTRKMAHAYALRLATGELL